MSVFVLDKKGRALMPCSEKRARLLLTRRKAFVKVMQPFTIQLKERLLEDSELQSVELKLDPGSRHTGMALVRDAEGIKYCLNLYQLDHCGQMIHRKLLRRAMYRKQRRSRKTRYRQARFLNRRKPKGWLAPSLMHRVNSTLSWALKFQRWVPLTKLVVERNRFDIQKLQRPEIKGIEYQRGTLFGMEVWEYLLEKWGHRCVYCEAPDRKLTIDHVTPRSRGGSDRVSNLVPACEYCNQFKGNKPVQEFLKRHPDRLKRILEGLKQSLKDAAAVNSTRYKLIEVFEQLKLPIETDTGAMTKWNRRRLNVPKTHSLDALCVGDVRSVSDWIGKPTQVIACYGRGRYQRVILDRFGFPKANLTRIKRPYGFGTGDIAQVFSEAHVKRQFPFQISKMHRLTVKIDGFFQLARRKKIVKLSYRYLKMKQRNNGYFITLQRF